MPSTEDAATVVHVLDDYQRVAEDLVDWTSGPQPLAVRFFHDHLDDPAELRVRHEEAEVLVAMRERTPLPEELLSALPRLRLVVTTGLRNSSIDVDAAARHGILVCGTNALTSPTAELTWGLILAAARNIPDEQQRLRAGAWQDTIGIGLEGRRLGIVGLGGIGARVARVAQAFEMETVAWSQNLTSERAAELGVRRVEKGELFAGSDFVTLHLRLSERSRGLVAEEELRAMGGAWLVNTSRAEIVDQRALSRALHEGWIAGLATDVYDVEPLPPRHPLLEAPRTVLTPHLGYVVEQNYELFYREAHEDIVRFLAGDPVRVISPGGS